MFKKLLSKIGNSGGKPSTPRDLTFKDNVSAFEYACKYCVTNILPKQGLIAIVESEPGNDERGNTYCAVKVSSDDGGFVVPALIATRDNTDISKGSLVIWVPYEHDDSVGKVFGDERKGWIGFVVAIANPILNGETGWSIAKRLT